MDLTFLHKKSEKDYEPVLFKTGTYNCRVCGKSSDFSCRVTEDEGLAICKYTPSNRMTKDNRYKHILNESSVQENRNFVEEMSNYKETSKADSDRLNDVYTTFLYNLQLNDLHRHNLIERGLSEETIELNLYRSVPNYSERIEVAEKLAESFDLEGIPGFFRENGKWCLNLTFPGFYVPYRDTEGRISGLQIRRDKETEQKYLWLSSSGKEKGTSSGVSLHFVNSKQIRESGTIWITESALKGDITAELLPLATGFVAMGGVNAIKPEKLIDDLRENFPDLVRVILAFDMDWKEKKGVHKAVQNLFDNLRDTDLEVDAVIWDEQQYGKGIDDACLSGLNQKGFYDQLNIVSEFDFVDMLDACDFEKSNEPLEIDTRIEKENDVLLTKTISKAEIRDEIDTFGISLEDFLAMELEEPEKIMFGICKGNLGLMVAGTNVGKTTLALNLILSIGANKTFHPLFEEINTGRRVMYIDGEATKSELQADLMTMLMNFEPSEQARIKNNLSIICDEEIDEESLDLVNPEHLKKIQEKAIEFKPDLIIVDTLSALTTLEDENDNAKVKREIIQPLKNLGKKANTGVLLLHHSGKYSEGKYEADDSYKGRGASTFGGSSRVIFNLKSGKGNNKGKIVLSCSKVKGKEFDPVVLELNEESRWFNLTGEIPNEKINRSDKKHNTVVDYVFKSKRKVKYAELLEKFTPKEMSDSTLQRKLKEAVENGDLSKQHGVYFSPELQTDIKEESCKISDNYDFGILYDSFEEMPLKK